MVLSWLTRIFMCFCVCLVFLILIASDLLRKSSATSEFLDILMLWVKVIA